MDIEILDSAVKKVQHQNFLTEMEIFRNHARTEGGCIINSTIAFWILWLYTMGLKKVYGLNQFSINSPKISRDFLNSNSE